MSTDHRDAGKPWRVQHHFLIPKASVEQYRGKLGIVGPMTPENVLDALKHYFPDSLGDKELDPDNLRPALNCYLYEHTIDHQ